MREALLDTDILSEVLKGRDAVVRERARAYLGVHRRLTTSALTVLEIAYGFERRGRTRELEAYLARLAGVRQLALEPDEGELAGRILGELERAGTPIGQLDPMIASIAISRRLVLITGNSSDYRHIVNAGYLLDLDDWRSPREPSEPRPLAGNGDCLATRRAPTPARRPSSATPSATPSRTPPAPASPSSSRS